MKIDRIEAIGVNLPLSQPLKRSKGVLTTSDNLIVRIECGHVVGWGEAGSAPTMTGELLAGMSSAVEYLAPHLEGLPLDDIAGASAQMEANLYGNRGAKAAIEMALYDALGKSVGRPLHDLLGTRRRARIAALRYIASGDTERDVADAARLKREGFVAYKIKVGAKDLRSDIERTQRICETLGTGLMVSADANQGWTRDQAVEYVRAVADTSLVFLEQPLPADDLDGMAEVVAASRIEIGCDEGVRTAKDLHSHFEARAAHGASLKIGKLGGVMAAYRTGLVCEELAMKVNLSCKIAESGIGTAAVLHLAAAMPSLDWGVSLTSQYLGEDVLARPLQFSGGYVDVPSRPGLGIEVDEARVRAFRVKH